MFFIVTGNGQNGTVAVTCNSAAAALEKAHQLDRNGVIDLLITDADGLQHAPADFDRLYVAPVP
jgi:peptidyl-tRNA hydrolase